MNVAVVGSLLLNADELVADMVRRRLPIEAPIFGPYRALGVVGRDGTLVAGVVFHNWRGHDIEVTCAADDPRWASRPVLAALFSYPFLECGCARVTAITGAGNTRTRRFLRGIGFAHEGTHARGLDGVEDALSFGMTRDACRWLKD